MLEKIQLLQSVMILTLCTFGGITLLLHPRPSKSKRILGYSMLFWMLLVTVRLFINPFLDSEATLFHPLVLIMGTYVTATTSCYIIEVLRPGYLTFKRFFVFIFPAILCSGLWCSYFLFMREIPAYCSLRDFLVITKVDVTLRVLLLVCTISYMAIPIILTLRYNKQYTRFFMENTSSPEDYDLKWLKRTMHILSAIYLFYFILLLSHNIILYVINKGIILILWYYLFYKALFLREIPWLYTFSKGWELPQEGEDDKDSESPYILKKYAKEIDQWFKSEKPYLCKDLYLSDLQKKVLISRTYLSQVFNKELGMSFSDYVNKHRIEESKKLFQTEPLADINDIAERSGFNSTSTFRRAFVKYEKVSPSEYKKKVSSHHLNTP